MPISSYNRSEGRGPVVEVDLEGALKDSYQRERKASPTGESEDKINTRELMNFILAILDENSVEFPPTAMVGSRRLFDIIQQKWQEYKLIADPDPKSFVVYFINENPETKTLFARIRASSATTKDVDRTESIIKEVAVEIERSLNKWLEDLLEVEKANQSKI